MADPKIKYDIEAAVKGEASVDELEGALRDLSETLEGDLQKSATDAANALAALGAKKNAVDTFQALKRETADLAGAMESAAQKVDALGNQLPEAAAATARFAEAETQARTALAGSKTELDTQRAALVALRTEYTGAARGSTEYKEANATLQTTIKGLRTEIQEQRTQVTAAAAATRTAQTAEKALTSEYNNSVSAARNVSAALGNKNRALADSRSAMQQVGLETVNLAQAERNLDAAIGGVRAELLTLAPAYRAAAAASATATQTQVQNQRTLTEGFDSVRSSLQRIQGIATIALGGSYVGGLIKDVSATADEFKNLEARIKLVTGEGPLFQASFKGVADVALRTNSALDETATLFARITKAGTDAGLSAQAAQSQGLALTSTINQAIQLSGASADASKAAITQLIQGLQSGVLRGEEFNSVMEQAPRLAQALAQGLGVTTGELRKMAEQGALTSDVVIKSLRGQSDAVAAEFGKLPPTVGRALQNLTTQWTLYVGAADHGLLSSANAAKVVDALAGNLDVLVGTLYAAGKAYAAIKIAGLAADAIKWATATASATEATVASTAAVAANTAATRANTAAKGANAAAQTGLGASVAASAGEAAKAGIVWRSFSALFGPLGIAVAVLGPEIVGLAQKAGEAAARWVGWGKVLDENEAKLRAQDTAAKDLAEAQRRLAVSTADAAAKQFGLSKEAATTVASFDELRKKGDSASDAIGKIGKDFDLASAPGIRNAAGVLDKLLTDGKLTATQFQAAWATALDGQDLLQFEVRARTALAGTAREAERVAQVMDASLREAVKRSGLEFTALQGNVGAASRSAINDVDLIVRSLDSLKAQGIDTGRVLSASITKAIDTADSEKAVAALRTQIEGLRGQLGATITDGLLDQARQKSLALKDALDAATPGINSIREAYKQLGITAPEELDRIAKANAAAWALVRADGNSSADTLKKAFASYADAAVAASGKVGGASKELTQSLLQNEASAKGLEVTFDASGRAMVRAIGETKTALDGLGKSYSSMGDAAVSAAERATTALEKQNAAIERANAATEKAIELENKRRGVDSSGFAANDKGERITAGGDLTTRTGIAAFLKAAGVTDDAAARKITMEFADSRGNIPYAGNPGQMKYGGPSASLSEALLKAAEQYTFSGRNTATSAIPDQTKTINVEVNYGGTTYKVPTTAAGSTVLEDLISALADAKGKTGK